MPEVEEAGFSCTACGRQYRWKPELAGKSVKCKCGSPVKVPREMGASAPLAEPQAAARSAPPRPAAKKQAAPVASAAPSDDGLDALYALAEQEAAVGSDESRFCPNCGSQLSPDAVLCTACGFDRRKGKVVAAMAKVEVAKPKKSLFGGGGKPKPVDPKKKKVQDALAPQGSFFIGVLTSFALATGAALIYAIAAWGIGLISFGLGNYIAAFLISLVGIGAGIGMQMGQKGYSTLGGIAAAGVTLVVMLIARVLVIVLFGISIISGMGAGKHDTDLSADPDARTDGREDVGDIRENMFREAEKIQAAKAEQQKKWDAEQNAVAAKMVPEDPRLLRALEEQMYVELHADPKFASEDQRNAAVFHAQKRAETMPADAKKKIIAVMAEREKKEQMHHELVSMVFEQEWEKVPEHARSGPQYGTTHDLAVNKVDKMSPEEQEKEHARLTELRKQKLEKMRQEDASRRAKALADAATQPATTQAVAAAADDGLGGGSAAGGDDGLGGDTSAANAKADGDPDESADEDGTGDTASANATATPTAGGSNAAAGGGTAMVRAAMRGQNKASNSSGSSSSDGSSDGDSSGASTAVAVGVGIILFYVFFGGIWSFICMLSAIFLAYRTAAGAVKG
jgi:hypothetical protein